MKRSALCCIALWLAGSLIGAAASKDDFVRSQGRRLVVGSEERTIALRGVNFTNDAWASGSYIVHSSRHHAGTDFERVAGLGMNVIRLMLSYSVFELDEAPFVYNPLAWSWLDRQVALARENGLYLILVMQRPQGATEPGNQQALWSDERNQERLIALWTAIAERYRDRPTVAAFSPLGEPTADLGQWQALATNLVAAIRTVDPNHLIIIESAYGSSGPTFYLINDSNLMYDLHLFSPQAYTHQYSPALGHGDGGRYPDREVSHSACQPVAAAIANPPITAGTSSWDHYQGQLYQVTDPATISAQPVLVCGATQGTVAFDDLVIEEYDSDGQPVRQVMWVDIEEVDHEREWEYTGSDPFASFTRHWQELRSAGETATVRAGVGHLGQTSLTVSDVSSGLSLTNPKLRFAVRHRYQYRISGWMQGEGVGGDRCQLSLRLCQLEAGQERVPFDRTYLEREVVENLVTFAQTHEVPLNVGEFGLISHCFETGIAGDSRNRGGLEWVRDLLTILDQHGIGYQYFAYHLADYGLYGNRHGYPDPEHANSDLMEVFAKHIRNVLRHETPRTSTARVAP